MVTVTSQMPQVGAARMLLPRRQLLACPGKLGSQAFNTTSFLRSRDSPPRGEGGTVQMSSGFALFVKALQWDAVSKIWAISYTPHPTNTEKKKAFLFSVASLDERKIESGLWEGLQT